MNGREAADRFGGIEEKFVAEALETRGIGEGRIIRMNSKKKIAAITVAAVLAGVLAVSAVAVGLSGLGRLKKYVDKQNEFMNVPDALADVDLEEIGTEPEEDIPGERPFEPRVSGIITGKGGLIATVEMDVSDDAEFAALSPDEPCWYEFPDLVWYIPGEDGGRISFGSSGHADFVSLEDGIVTAALKIFTGDSLPDSFVIGLSEIVRHDITSDTDASYTFGEEKRIEIDKDLYTPLECVKSKNTATVRGVEFTAEMDGLGIYFTSTADEHTSEENQVLLEIYDECPLTFRLRDGSEIVENWKDFNFDAPKLIGSGTTGAQYGKISYGFVTVFDVTQIESVEIDGERFEF